MTLATQVDGNDHTFSVVPRAPYEVPLLPGWNLISLPGTPLDQNIQSVMVATSASAVLGYRQGNWESAIRTEAEDGTSSWQGSLTSMEGGYGFWIQTDQLREHRDADTGSGPGVDTPDGSGGWRMEPAGCDRREAGSRWQVSPLEKSEADDYFTSIPWRVAYSFETIRERVDEADSGDQRFRMPNKATADPDDTIAATEIANGKGYWVWSSEPGTLVP